MSPAELSQPQAVVMVAAGLVALHASTAAQVLFVVLYVGVHVFNRLACAEVDRQRESLS